MQTHFLFDVLEGYKPFEQMVQESQKSGAVIAASGMAGAQKAHAACALAARTGRPLLFLCDSERSATQTMEDPFRAAGRRREPAPRTGNHLLSGCGGQPRGGLPPH